MESSHLRFSGQRDGPDQQSGGENSGRSHERDQTKKRERPVIHGGPLHHDISVRHAWTGPSPAWPAPSRRTNLIIATIMGAAAHGHCVAGAKKERHHQINKHMQESHGLVSAIFADRQLGAFPFILSRQGVLDNTRPLRKSIFGLEVP